MLLSFEFLDNQYDEFYIILSGWKILNISKVVKMMFRGMNIDISRHKVLFKVNADNIIKYEYTLSLINELILSN